MQKLQSLQTGGCCTLCTFVAQRAREIGTEPFIEIIDRESGNRVGTVIEFLSPSNKTPGPNREQYLRRQREITASDPKLVEIDLNRFRPTPTRHFLEPRMSGPSSGCARRGCGP